MQKAGEAGPKERAWENQSEDKSNSSKAREGGIKEPGAVKGSDVSFQMLFSEKTESEKTNSAAASE